MNPQNDPNVTTDDSKSTQGQQRATRKRKSRFFGVFVMVCAVPPFINSIDNPRVATLHGADVFRLLVAGSLFGFGLALLISEFIIFRE
jgi:hypothetical protein